MVQAWWVEVGVGFVSAIQAWNSPHAWQTRAGVALAALLIDALVGDPQVLVHPVVCIGRLIHRLDTSWRHPGQSGTEQRIRGLGVALIVPVISALAVALVGWATRLVHPWLAAACLVGLASTTIAARGLSQAGCHVYAALADGDLTLARRRVGEIVGRDTANLNRSEVSRAAIETVAENTVDAIVSPVCFILLGGAPMGMAYRAINTLDSMLGYKNEKYRYFGWAAARSDDIANWIPARITAVILPIAAAITGARGINAWRTIWRDAKAHPSPNSGIPEAGMAGALDIQLGGVNFYQGVAEERATMGTPHVPIEAKHIVQSVRIMWVTTAILAAILLTIILILT